MDSNNFETSFWKVIHNKVLFKLIFKNIKNHNGCKNNNNNNKEIRFYQLKDYNNFFENRKSFKDISSLNWMVENNQIQLLLCKLKNNEYIKINNGSISNLLKYFNQQLNSDSNTSTKEQQNNHNELFKEILKLLLKFEYVKQSKLLSKTNNESTFKLVLQVLNELNIEIPDSFKNKSFNLNQGNSIGNENDVQMNEDETDQSKFKLQESFIKSISQCDINSLKSINEMNIDWSLVSGDNIKKIISKLKFSKDEINKDSLINLIDYLNKNGYKNFNELVFTTFVNSLISVSDNVSFLLKRIITPKKYLVELFKIAIEKSLSNEIIELILVQSSENGEMEIFKTIEIFEFFNDENENLLNQNVGDIYIHVNVDQATVNNLISTIKLMVNNLNNENSAVISCLVHYLYLNLISISNITIHQLKEVYEYITNNNIELAYNKYHLFCYLLKRSPNSIAYLIKFIENITFIDKDHGTAGRYLLDSMLDESILPLEFIFDPDTNEDEIFNRIMDYSTNTTMYKFIDDQDDYRDTGYIYSFLIDYNFKFILSISRIDLFFKYLNVVQQQLNDTTFIIDGGLHCNPFPNFIKNQKSDLFKQYDNTLKRKLLIFVSNIRNRIADWKLQFDGVQVDKKETTARYLCFHTSNDLIRYAYDYQLKDSALVCSPRVIYELFDKPYHRFISESHHYYPKKSDIKEQIPITLEGNIPPPPIAFMKQYFLVQHFKNKELDELEINNNTINNKSNQHQQEYNIYCECNGNDGCNNGLREIINGRVYYFNINVYHNAIKVMDVCEFKEFIKFCSYRSFIQFLYSYGIKVKYLLRHYYLINHILLNHNHLYKNKNQRDENIKFILNYWDQVFRFEPLKEKTINGFEKIMKFNNINNSTILNQLISFYKLNYNDQFYHYEKKHSFDKKLLNNDKNLPFLNKLNF